ncbi:regulatory LuxR family protein [Krasilnikovia cinnamomea]|uniref:Regulatory LuxR family protein n=1 Tax=Krasilnikovia cinnamomea TaxID=349313 RepID=A0A4Q7ZA68_9ACTN|nr:regulatory LuxR family protein [Krasilnikovia cinnamomea]
MRKILVCVRTPLAAQTVASTAARLGMTSVVHTAVNEAEAMIRLAEDPAEIVLADTAVTRPDSVGFTRRILAHSPQAQVVLFGAEDPRVAAAAVGAGARGVIRGVEHDLVSAVAKALMLLLLPARPQDLPAQSPSPPTSFIARTAVAAGVPHNISSAVGYERGSSSGNEAPTPTRLPSTQVLDVPSPETAARKIVDEADDLTLIWQLIEESSLGSTRRVAEQVDPGQAAQIAAAAADQPGRPKTDPVHFLLLAFVRAWYENQNPEDNSSAQMTKLADLLIAANRPELAMLLWRLAAAAGDSQAHTQIQYLLEHARRWQKAATEHGRRRDDPVAEEVPAWQGRQGQSAHLDRLQPNPRERPVSTRIGLTERELQVLRGMADGKSNAEIARELYVSEDTVKTHARRLFRKLGARDRAHAVAAGFRYGLVA